MRAEEILRYAAEWRAASDLPPCTGAAVTPLMLSPAELEEIVDCTQLTGEQLLRLASRGLLIHPE